MNIEVESDVFFTIFVHQKAIEEGIATQELILRHRDEFEALKKKSPIENI